MIRQNLDGFVGAENAEGKARQYDGKTSQHSLDFISRSIGHLPSLARELHCLDLGGGNGHYADALTRLFNCYVDVVDYSPDMLASGQVPERFADNERLRWVTDEMPGLASYPGHADYPFLMALGSFQFMSAAERVQSLKRTADLAATFGRFVIMWPYPTSRPGQESLTQAQFALEVSQSGQWHIAHTDELPYPVTDNIEAIRNGSRILACDLKRLS